jgi:hypothetical protein
MSTPTTPPLPPLPESLHASWMVHGQVVIVSGVGNPRQNGEFCVVAPEEPLVEEAKKALAEMSLKENP